MPKNLDVRREDLSGSLRRRGEDGRGRRRRARANANKIAEGGALTPRRRGSPPPALAPAMLSRVRRPCSVRTIVIHKSEVRFDHCYTVKFSLTVRIERPRDMGIVKNYVRENKRPAGSQALVYLVSKPLI
ncbi:hypothetical protein EVAR_51471_1 [Eumeta japonica]|uniref:Uncharacterized protein n=1 Tax=Eumeta variegata TaxID=151549 RepID=A0A4C1Z685_EUMVA|nr:hypothetical protein EVAR_51471_1 [Eumeta japonica]